MESLRFSRHARNRMRWFGLTPADICEVLASPEWTGQDDDGNALVDGQIRGVRICVVIAQDDPTRVITIFKRRRGREG
jgi:Domain of unknown function (DUF4258)